ncbi:MAG: tetratricopeptide repeat protein [Desulfuromusa sp.]|nr:tetratricopeptide repeat protein [Desulfuromusa sp.]
MKRPCPFLVAKFIPLLGLMLLLSSCATTTGVAPSGALREQLYQIKEQQQAQATQLQQLQQQLGQLTQQLTTKNIITASSENNLDIPGQLAPATDPLPIVPVNSSQFDQNQEIITIAASASSYLAAFSNLAAGQLASAEIGFQDFLRDFPDHQYAPNARYWLANAQLGQGETDLAITNLQQIITNPNAQAKAPAALVLLAQTYRQVDLPIQADKILEQLRKHYPESPEAQQINRSEEPTL